MVGANKFELNDGDVVEWYYGGMGSAPNNTDMLIRIETSYDYWNGGVPLGSGTFNVTADDSGKEYTINRTCALAAVIRAAEKGGFSYTINDSWYESYGAIYVDAIDGVNGWMYWVNYPDDPSPMVGAMISGAETYHSVQEHSMSQQTTAARNIRSTEHARLQHSSEQQRKADSTTRSATRGTRVMDRYQ
jgi:hypothetical protein